MRRQFIDLTGERFGRLTVIERGEDYISAAGYKSKTWKCRCDCGRELIVHASNLRDGKSQSCGCLKKELQRKNAKWNGESQDKLHYIWLSMLRRCNNSSDKSYNHYGGRGISVCDDWVNDYFAFKDWAINNGYQEGLSIERIDVNQGYNPHNCKWIPLSRQTVNKTNTIYLTHNGQKMQMSEWAKLKGINIKTLRNRIFAYLWDVDKAIETPVRNINRRACVEE